MKKKITLLKVFMTLCLLLVSITNVWGETTIPVTRISVSPATTKVRVGQTKQLSVAFTPTDATNKNVTWTSDQPEVATVDATGLVTTLKAGIATITATSEDGGFTSNCVVTVIGLTAISVTTEPRKDYLTGENFDPTGLVITATYSDGTTEEVKYAGNEEKFTFAPSLETALKTSDDKVIIGYGDVDYDLSITVKEPNVYHLVTDASQLAVGDVCIIVTKDNNRAMSTEQRKSNRGSVEILKDENKITEIYGLQELTLEAGTKENTFAFYTGSGYLYAASKTTNYLMTEEKLSDNSSWSISISESTASIKAQGENTHNVMQYYYNGSNPIFSCYESANYDALSIYKKEKILYTATYNVFGKEISTERILKEELIKNAPTPTQLNNWDFVGWTTDDTYTTGNTKPEIFDVSTPITSDLQLYAVFSTSTTTYTTEMPKDASVPITVTDFGLLEGNASFCSTFDLDFTDLEGIGAYIGKEVDGEGETKHLNLLCVDKVPTGTGIFVIGQPGTHLVPIYTGEKELEPRTDNSLIGTLEPHKVLESENIYALSKSDGNLHPVNTGVTIGAGKAYYMMGGVMLLLAC